ncbi:cytochrome c-type biogenesis protein CcmH [Microtetraspora fusca]|uniref:cytochrome c-type biogenesis protein CcmH n=1 Tax=Microtetraspora fusca TaxID=1997 RepID=UPI000829DAE1|nr:cytochrome c-type biogenesis protein CcmH [Microtetraspora fusca]
MTGRSLAARVATGGLAVLLALAALAVWRSAQREPADRATEVAEIASGLRCPDCEGLSAAESSSTMARAVREEIGRQLAQGHDPDQIRQFFASRYGPAFLLSPPVSGASAILWALPVVVFAVGCAAVLALLLRGRRRTCSLRRDRERGSPAPRPRRAGIALPAAAVAAGVLALLLARPDARAAPPPAPRADGPADLVSLGRTLDSMGDAEGAVRAYREAAALLPEDPRIPRLLGLALLKAGRPAEAVALLRPLLARSPDDDELLLVLGAAELTADPPAGRRTLRRFLRLAPPGHPAVARVRRLLAVRHDGTGAAGAATP